MARCGRAATTRARRRRRSGGRSRRCGRRRRAPCAPAASRATRSRFSRWSKNQPVFCPPSRSTGKPSPPSSARTGSAASPSSGAHLLRQPLQRRAPRRRCAPPRRAARAAPPAPPAAPAVSRSMPAVLACTRQRVAVAVDDQAGQAVRLGMDQAVEGRVVQALAQRQRAGRAARAASRRRSAAAGSRDRRRAAIRLCGLKCHAPCRTPSSPSRRTRRAGRQRLRRRGHGDLVGEGPRVARLHPPVAAGQQAQHGQVRTIEVRHGGGGTSRVRRPGATAGPLDLASWNRYGAITQSRARCSAGLAYGLSNIVLATSLD